MLSTENPSKLKPGLRHCSPAGMIRRRASPDRRGCPGRAALALRADIAQRADLQTVLYALHTQRRSRVVEVVFPPRSALTPCTCSWCSSLQTHSVQGLDDRVPGLPCLKGIYPQPLYVIMCKMPTACAFRRLSSQDMAGMSCVCLTGACN